MCSFFFFFNDTATTEIYTLSLHDALPILYLWERSFVSGRTRDFRGYLCSGGHEPAAKAATRHVPLKRHCTRQFTDKRRAAGLPADVMAAHDLQEARMGGKG